MSQGGLIRWTGYFARWLWAGLLGGILPLAAAYAVLSWTWDFGAQPPWSWLTLGIVPFGCLPLLFLSSRRIQNISPAMLATLSLHALTMATLLSFRIWPAIAGLALFIDLLLAGVLLRPATGRQPGQILRATIFWLVAVFGLGMPLAFLVAELVVSRAEAIAGDRPYCLQYASQLRPYDYEAVRTLFDLSALKMQARLLSGGSTAFHFQHHALLIIDDGKRQFFNWSYRQLEFMDEISERKLFKEPNQAWRMPSVTCQPNPHFGRRLPIWTANASEYLTSVGNHRFNIPLEFRPRRIDDRLALTATLPDFKPIDETTPRGPARITSDIAITTSGEANLHSLLQRRTEPFDVKSVEPEFGLDKADVYLRSTQSEQGRAQTPAVTLYWAKDSNGQTIRFIECSSRFDATPDRGRCRYTFVSQDLAFTLFIPDPSQWQTIDRNLLELMARLERR